ncbi:MAG: hypothetical protein ACJ8FY_25625 [Gemmataceae bacterium]
MVETTPHVALNLGFLTVLQEGNSYVGGFLVTNQWGRPLEFRLTTSVQPNRVQQILYGDTLSPYICADLVGRTLVEKTSTAANFIITDCQAALDLRFHCEVPVVWLGQRDNTDSLPLPGRCPVEGSRWPLHRHPRFPGDSLCLAPLLDRLDGVLDLAEPFFRVREAIGEARKMGVTKSA